MFLSISIYTYFLFRLAVVVKVVDYMTSTVAFPVSVKMVMSIVLYVNKRKRYTL